MVSKLIKVFSWLLFHSNDREVVLYLINNSDWELPYTLTTPTERHQRGLRVAC
ncbi:MAG: hypothetical protein R2822_18820 [Spirosomataceae bacterium]